MSRIFVSVWAFVILIAVPAAAQLNFNSGTYSFPIGQATVAFTPTGGSPPYTFSYAPSATVIPGFRVVNRPEVPSSFGASSTGGLVGVATAVGSYATTIRLTDGTLAFVDKSVTVVVGPVDVTGASTPDTIGVGDTVSLPYWGVGGTGGYTYSITSGSLPPGLTLDPNTGVIGGTATTAGTRSFTIRAQDGASNAYSRGYSITVSPLRLVSPSNRILPNHYVNLVYSETLQITGGSAPYTFSLAPNYTLPTGLTLSSTGAISGTPTGTTIGYGTRVKVVDNGGNTAYFYLALNILSQSPSPLTVTTGTLSDATAGQEITQSIYAYGGLPPYTFDLASGSPPLPDGTRLLDWPTLHPPCCYGSPQTAFLRGKVHTLDVHTFTVRVTDSAGNVATRPMSLRAVPLTFLQSYVPYSGPRPVLGVPYTQYLIPAGGTPPYTIAPVDIPAGMSVDNAGLLSGTPGEAGGANFNLYVSLADSLANQYTSNGWMSIDAPPPAAVTLYLTGGNLGPWQKGAQTLQSLYCSNSPENPPHFTVNLVSGSLPPGMTLLTGSAINNTDPTIAAQLAGVPTTPGTYTAILSVTDGLGNFGQRQLRMRVSSLGIVTSAFAYGTVGATYRQTLDVRGGSPPYTFSLTTGSLPTGLSLEASTGTISGVPSTTASTSVGIQVQDSAGDTYLRGYSLSIYSLEITSPNVLPMATYGVPYSYTFTASPPGAYTWTGSYFGLSLDPSTGVWSGVPTSWGQLMFTVTVGNGSTAAYKTFTLPAKNLSQAAPSLPGQDLGAFVVGSSVSYSLGAGGGTPLYTVTALSALPPGLSIVPAQTVYGYTYFGLWALAGVPTTAGSYSFRLRYTDSAGVISERTHTMTITTLSVATTSLRPGTVNVPYSVQLYGVGGSGSYSFTLADLMNNVLPPGLTLTPTGLLSGTPTSTGSFSFTLVLTSGAASRQITINLTIYATGTRLINFSLGPVNGDGVLGRGLTPLVLTPSGGAGAHTWTLVSGTLPPGLRLLTGSDLPSEFSPPQAVLVGVPTTLGTYSFRIRVDDSTGNFGVRDAIQPISPMRLGPTLELWTFNPIIPPGQVEVSYSKTLTCINGQAPCTFTALSGTYLPPGMSLSTNGLLNGTPTDAGSFTLNLLLTDANGATRRLSAGLTIYPAGRPIGLTGQGAVTSRFPPPFGTVDQPYTFALNDLLYPGYGTAPFTWSLTADSTPLPPGLNLVHGGAGASDIITGTPTGGGAQGIKLLAADANGMQHLVNGLILYVPTINLSPASGALPPATAGVPYSQTLTASGGAPPYTFDLFYSSDLPAGLSLSSAGVISGTPTSVGPFMVYVDGKDSTGIKFRQRYTLTVSPPGTPVPAITVAPSSVSLSYIQGNPAPAPIPLNIGSTGSNFAYSVSATGPGWLAVSPASGATPGTANVILTPPGAPGAYSGAVTVSSAGAANSPVTIPVTLTVIASGGACSYSLSPGSATLPASAGSGGFSVATTPSCSWTATSSVGWLSVNSPGSGTGNGTVSFTASANPDSGTRPGTITLQGLTYSVTQSGSSCSYSLSSASATLGALGGTGLVSINASPACTSWTASSVDGWVHVAPGSGTGSGSVTLTVDNNSGPFSRSATLSIAGLPFVVNQAGVGCSYSLSASSASMPSSGGAASVNMIAPAGCAWTADAGPSWTTIASGSPGSGNGTVNFSIAPNSTTVARSANLPIGGQSFQITQAGEPCSFSLSASNTYEPASGGSGSVDITAAGAGCGWVAASNAAWLTVAPPASGSGNGSVSFAAGINGGAEARGATLTIAGQNIVVSQAGVTCSYTLRSPSAGMPYTGGPSAVGVISASGCTWLANSSFDWIHVTGGASSSGTADVSFNVDQNNTAAPRSGTIAIAGQTFSVNQAAQPCTISLLSSSFSAGEFGGSSSFSYNTSVSGCNPAVQSYTSWITVLPTSTYVGTNGTVNFSVAANGFAAPRSGNIRVGDQVFTANQAASTCAYTLSSFAATFGRMGGSDATVPMNFAPPACGPPAVLVTGPAGMITLGPIPGTPTTYTQYYNVGIYQSFINYIRAAQLNIAGQIFAVKQSSW